MLKSSAGECAIVLTHHGHPQMPVITFIWHVFVTVVTYFLGIITLGESLASTITVFLPWITVILVTGLLYLEVLCQVPYVIPAWFSMVLFNTAPPSSFIHLWVNYIELDVLKSWIQIGQKMSEIKVKAHSFRDFSPCLLTVNSGPCSETEQKHSICGRAELFIFWWPGS